MSLHHSSRYPVVAHADEGLLLVGALLAFGAGAGDPTVPSIGIDDTVPADSVVRYKHLINADDVLVWPLLQGKLANNTSRTPVTFTLSG